MVVSTTTIVGTTFSTQEKGGRAQLIPT